MFSPPKGADLRERITIQVATLADDGAGGFTKTWAGSDTAAAVTPTGGREALLSSTLQAIQGYRVVIRWRPALKAADRIQWGDKTLNIRSAADPDGKRRWTVAFADAGTVDE